MKFNKLGAVILILCVFIMVVNAVAAEENSLVGTDEGKLLLENENQVVLLDDSNSDSNIKLSAANSQEELRSAEVGNYTELQNLIDSNPNGTIELDRNYNYLSSEKYIIQIPHSITINGNGHKISGENYAMSFYIPNTTSHVTLNNITFVNGKYNSMLWINGNNCIVDNCTFENNSASYGGAVYISGHDNVIDNCVFENNSASYGGAVYIRGCDNSIQNSTFKGNGEVYYGGAITIDNARNSVYNCTFENNNAKYYGGAVDIFSTDNVVDNCTFKNNHVDYCGGAIALEKNDNLVNNSVFNNNSADYYGGAVYVIGDNNVIDNSTFAENALNEDQGCGAAVYVCGNDVEILNSDFNNHNAYDGGAVKWLGSNGKIEGSKFNKNTAKCFGGAIHWEGVNGTIEGSKFNENRARYNGGAVYVAKPNLIINGSEFTINSANGLAGAVYISTDNVTVNNSEFYYNHANDAGAIDVYGSNNTIDNSIFEYNIAYNDGGAVVMGYYYLNPTGQLNNTIRASKFSDNKATRYGGAVRIDSEGNAIDASEFYYNNAQIGGAVSINSKHNNIDHSNFKHNQATDEGGAVNLNTEYLVINNTNMTLNKANYGGAVYVNYWALNAVVDNSNFVENEAFSNGGAIYWHAQKGTVNNSAFNKNWVHARYLKSSATGGAITSYGNDLLINNSEFTWNGAHNYGGASDGGALNLEGQNAVVVNCDFESNVADSSGGAIRWIGENGLVYNSTFTGNNVSVEGGAIYAPSRNIVVNRSTFTKNSALAYIGGALALDSSGTVDNSSFIENFAYKGGAIHWMSAGNILVNNSYFYKNHGVYAGGAIACDYYYTNAENKHIKNTRFINNTCVNYGGAVATLNTGMDNCTFINNSAKMGGAVHSYDSIINGSQFSGNHAKYGNDIYHSGEDDLINIIVPQENVVYVSSGLAEIIRYNIGNSTRLMNNSYIGMCFERNSYMPKYGAYDESLYGLTNVLTGEDIVEYLKLMVYISFNSMEDVYPHEGDNFKLYPEGWEGMPESEDLSNWIPISRTDYYSRVVHVFSDHDFRKSAHPVVKKILELYDSGVRINQDHQKLVNGTLIKYHFSTLMSPASQSLFLFLISPVPKVDKVYLNTTDFIKVNDTVAFNITVNNTGDKPLVNITLHEIYNSDELEYICHSDNTTWIKNNNTFTYYQDPDVGDIIVYDIYLENTGECNLENIIFSNVYNPNQLEFVKCANADLIKDGETFLYIDELRAKKTKTLSLFFKILEKDLDLDEMTPTIVNYKLSEDNYWNPIIPGLSIERQYQGRFPAINVGETKTFTIWFKTLTNGTLVNNISLYSIGLKEELVASNKTKVYQPDMTVEKIALNKTVYVGNQTVFTIVVCNTGDCDLGDVTVVERSYDGLVFDSYVDSIGSWKHIGDKFVLDGILAKGASASFNVIFNTTVRGNFTNVVVASSNVTENKTANNNTTVLQPDMKVEKIALNKTVYVGNQTTFAIVVTNTGDCDLGDVAVVEKSYDGLVFDSYVDGVGSWIRIGDRFVLDGILAKGASASFNVIFNTTVRGNFTNVVVASSNMTENKTANNNTTVLQPDMKVEKIALNKTVYVGNQTTFAIVVTNTGDCDLGDVAVVEKSYDGLVFDSYVDGVGSWICIGDRFVLDGILAKGASASFNVIFNTTVRGNFTNVVVASSNMTENKTANNNTTVLLPSMTVEKVALNKTVYVGNQTVFTIVVCNIGDCDLGDVAVVEKSYDGLVFDSYVDGVGSWICIGDRFVLDGILAKGASASFNVIFNTTVRGNFTNVVVASSNVTENKTANNNTTVLQPAMTVEKVALNKTAYVGDVIAFDIVVRNTGDCDLGDVTVSEIYNSDELSFIGYSDDALWIRSGNVFVYQGVLGVGEDSVFTVWFKALTNGTLVNNVTARSNVTDDTPGNNTTTVYQPAMTVEKVALNKSAYVGDVIAFDIVVRNTGDCDLGDVTVSEIYNSDELSFIGYSDDALWIRSGNVFVYQGVLGVGEDSVFTVWFKALTNGTLVNNVTARSNVTDDTPGNNTTTVYQPAMTVEKVALNKSAYVGDVIAFDIVVRNTGDCDLGDVTVSEIYNSDELSFIGYSDDALWIRSGNVFVYQGVLGVGEDSVFTVWFKALTNGTLVNNVTARSNVTDDTPGNNTTTVYQPDMKVEKVALNKSAYVGDVIAFDIVVCNTGDCDLGDVTVSEIYNSDELSFIGYSDDALWIRSGNVFVYQGVLGVGEDSVFTVWFKALTNGTLVNNVTARSNVTDETPGNNTTTVYNPDMKVEKISLNKTVYVGSETSFTIVVTNTGDCDLSDIKVVEKFDDALRYDGKFSGENWYNEGTEFIYGGILNPGQSASFNITFVAMVNGTWRNTVYVSSNGTEEKSANNTTEVLPICDVEVTKLVDSHIHYLDENIIWTIIVNNNGPNDALNVNVSDILPNTLRLLDANASKGNYADGVWIIGTLKSGEKQILTLITNALKSNVTITNTAVVNTTTPESNITNNIDNNTTEIKQKVSLAIEKSVSNSTPHIGDTITWTITVTNNGPDAAEDVVIEDILPEGLILVNGGRVFEIGLLEPNESVSVSVITLVNATGSIVNVATVTTTSNNTGDNETNKSINVTKVVVIEIEEVPDSTPDYGSEINEPDVIEKSEEPEDTPILSYDTPEINTGEHFEVPIGVPDVEVPEEVPDVEVPEEVPDVEVPEEVPEEVPDVDVPEEVPDVDVPEEVPEEVPDINVTTPVPVDVENNNSTKKSQVIPKNSTKQNTPIKTKAHKTSKNVEVNDKQTANPIAVLMLALISIVALQIKRKRK